MIAVRMPRRSKYGAQAVVIDGIRFASKREGKRYAELKLLAKAGEINALEIHPDFPVEIATRKLFTYIADFSYYVPPSKAGEMWTRVVEDVKGIKTPVYKLKKKIVEAIYCFEITEV
jgi:hypothetical protein